MKGTNLILRCLPDPHPVYPSVSFIRKSICFGMTPSPADDFAVVIVVGAANLMTLLVKARLHVNRGIFRS